MTRQDAIATLEESLAKHPGDLDTLIALATFNHDAGNIASAFDYAERLAPLASSNPGIARLLDDLRRWKESPP